MLFSDDVRDFLFETAGPPLTLAGPDQATGLLPDEFFARLKPTENILALTEAVLKKDIHPWEVTVADITLQKRRDAQITRYQNAMAEFGGDVTHSASWQAKPADNFRKTAKRLIHSIIRD